MISELEKDIVRALQEGLPLVSRPYQVISQKLGVTEELLIFTIKDMISRGLIRRFGAAVRHQDLGFNANAMVVWRVPEPLVDLAGDVFTGFPQVSHCYQRSTGDDWEYNLFTMVHGHTGEECRSAAVAMSEATGIKEYLILYSMAELKKTSMKYFLENEKG